MCLLEGMQVVLTYIRLLVNFLSIHGPTAHNNFYVFTHFKWASRNITANVECTLCTVQSIA